MARNIPQMGKKALPLGRCGLAGLPGVALSQAGNEQWLAGLEARRLEVCDESLVHLYGLHEFDVAEIALRTNGFRPVSAS